MKKIFLLAFFMVLAVLIISCLPPAEESGEKTAMAGLAISKGCYDADNDGYGRSGRSIATCSGSTMVFDCDDANRNVNPNAQERCGNSIDDNCNGRIDEAGCATSPVTPFCYYLNAAGERMPAGTSYENLFSGSPSLGYHGIVTQEGTFGQVVDLVCNGNNLERNVCGAVNPHLSGEGINRGIIVYNICFDGCNAGSCIILQSNCIDSDGGVVATIGGTAATNSSNIPANLRVLTDSCQSSTILNETMCNSNRTNSTRTFSYPWWSGGINCVTLSPSFTCIDPDNSGPIPAYCGSSTPVCGNGILESGELCDDGNTIAGDSCTLCRCADSDGGTDQYEAGTVTTSAGAVNDYCDQTAALLDSSRSIFERYCDASGVPQAVEKRCGDDINTVYKNEFISTGQNCFVNSPSLPTCVVRG